MTAAYYNPWIPIPHSQNTLLQHACAHMHNLVPPNRRTITIEQALDTDAFEVELEPDHPRLFSMA